MDITGAGQTNVSRSVREDFGAMWGSDGRLYFTTDRSANVELVLANQDGSGRRTIASSATDELMPAWSPDGQRIAFSSERDGDAEIFVAPASGGGLVQVTRNQVDDLDPTWSRDGRCIAFIRDPDDDYAELWVADADGRNAHRLLQPTRSGTPNGRRTGAGSR